MIVRLKYFSTLEQITRRRTFKKVDGVGFDHKVFWILRKNGNKEDRFCFLIDLIKEIEVY